MGISLTFRSSIQPHMTLLYFPSPPPLHVQLTMEEAVQMAYYAAEKGEAVLMSPASASFNMFENYEERGNRFKQLVRNL